MLLLLFSLNGKAGRNRDEDSFYSVSGKAAALKLFPIAKPHLGAVEMGVDGVIHSVVENLGVEEVAIPKRLVGM